MRQKSALKRRITREHNSNFRAGYININEQYLHKTGIRGRKRYFLYCLVALLFIVAIVNALVRHYIESARHWSQGICSPISQIYLKISLMKRCWSNWQLSWRLQSLTETLLIFLTSMVPHLTFGPVELKNNLIKQNGKPTWLNSNTSSNSNSFLFFSLSLSLT